MNRNMTKIFIGGLSRETSDTSLASFFDKFGEVVSAEVLRDHQTMNSRGFGFVTFKEGGIAEKVISMGTHLPFYIDGKQVEVKSAVPKEREITGVLQNNLSLRCGYKPKRGVRSGSELFYRPSLFNDVSLNTELSRSSSLPYNRPQNIQGKIFVGGLSYTTGHEALKNCFLNFGAVASSEVIYNRETKKSRGFGFIVFVSNNSVDRVMSFQNSHSITIDGKTVEVKPCKPKDIPKSSQTSSLDFESLLRDLNKRDYNFVLPEQKDEYYYDVYNDRNEYNPFTSTPSLYSLLE